MKLDEAVKLLQEVAKRGFLSEPQIHWLNKDETDYYVTWLPQESRAMREFLAENQFLAGVGRHEIGLSFGEPSRKTISLLGRISYAMSGQHINPEFVSGLAMELKESEQEYKTIQEQLELERMM